MLNIDWDGIISALELWRFSLNSPGGSLPSVSTVAEHYKDSSCERAWAVLVSTVISLRTKDAVTLAASERLLKEAASAKDLQKLSAERIEKLIYPCGFYKTKAQNLKKIADILLEKYSGRVPCEIDLLLELPGVGRKTANLVLIEGYDLEGICVDTHVHRISCRAGWVQTKTPDDTEATLRSILPKKFWKRINAILVLYGQNVCCPISPYCSKCVIKKHCKRVNVDKSR
ncbi:MAG: endonuclease III [Termitinemataceae bacterium]|nr:MAG: endonuclease III [Termitinemataceae bacterium]